MSMADSPDFGIRPAAGACGAFVDGVDLTRPLSDQTVERLRRALHVYGVLFFGEHDLTPSQQVAFARRFGRLHVHPYAPNLGPEHPEVLVLTETARGVVHWHTDSTYEEFPPLGSILHAQSIPSVGGDTIWSSMCAAYDALSPAMQRFLIGLHAMHGGEKITKFMRRNGTNADKPMLSATHPVVITDPLTGRKALFVNEDYTAKIEELSQHESDALLAMLHKHSQAPEFSVRLKWRPKMVAFWCNPITQHYPIPDYSEPRRMHRVTVQLDQRPA
jgi:taurine dioxygenase